MSLIASVFIAIGLTIICFAVAVVIEGKRHK